MFSLNLEFSQSALQIGGRIVDSWNKYVQNLYSVGSVRN